ncbi:MAG: M28 family peptidase, partial [Planctomycetota bacterium]
AGFDLEVQEYKAGTGTYQNVVGVRKGRGAGTILVGTHYDSYGKSPCANASGTGVATVLELARKLGREQVDPTVIVGFFGTGEEPHVGEETMGAQVWLDAYQEEGRATDAAYLIGSFGCFREGIAGQNSAFPWYLSHPASADWVGVYGAFTGRGIVEDTLAQWGRATKLPARGFAAPHWMLGVPNGDQIPFQRAGIPAVLLSDTGGNRDQELRKSADVPYVLDYSAMAQRVIALTTLLKSVVTSPLSGEAVASAD